MAVNNSNTFAGTYSFVVTIFLSAFLLFEVQPILGKYILPWFGGTSAVWTTCMLVYQAMLLFGYLYAHALSKFSQKSQAIIHLVFLGISIALLLSRNASWATSILPGPEWKPVGSATPVSLIAITLLSAIGIPLMILSATSSLMQSWFSRIQPDQTPYTFYMVSNIGSLLALLSYPFLIEPFITLKMQAVMWSACYGLFVVLCGCCAVRLCSSSVKMPAWQEAQAVPTPSFRTHLVWLFFSMCSSIILLATTSQITQNVAPVPMLWILPLSVYLLSFAICFRPGRAESNDIWIPITLASIGISIYAMRINSFTQTIAFTLNMFACCMLSHSELYRRRPHQANLTSFYLMIALGGVAGGILTGIIAPLVFNNLFEFDLILSVYVLIAICLMATMRRKWMKYAIVPLSIAALAMIGLLLLNARTENIASIYRTRNFYGTLCIRKLKDKLGVFYTLVNGRVKHGTQYESEPFHNWPTQYYGEHSGIGMAFSYNTKRLSKQPMRIGAIGLGIGTIAVYGMINDYFRFYEINPDVINLIKGAKYFKYICDSPALVDIVSGDARISMEQERLRNKPQCFDLLVIDAFNSDAIPIHLLTLEAFQLYNYHLASDAVIAIHVSNGYIDLIPVAISAAEHFNMYHVVIRNRGNMTTTQPSVWVLLTKNKAFTELPEISAVSMKEPKNGRKTTAWTDDFSNLFSVLKRF